ncbi:MAG: S8 family serine peptidase [Lachnospiraceae bacterium]|nr:S8 family serine peptidase [Lachnospiraceae bacterium]
MKRGTNRTKMRGMAILLKRAVVLTVTMAITFSCIKPVRSVWAAQEDAETEDKQYIIYIDLPDETEEISDPSISVSDGENPVNEAMNFSSEAEDTVSGNAVSENAAIESSVNDSANDTGDTAPELILQEIQEAEQLLEESADSVELTKNENAIVYEADLTKKELQKLEQSGADVYVEENIELTGAGGKSKGKPQADRMAVKEQTQEAEWNIRMVHGDVDSDLTGEPVKVAIMDSGIELLSGIPVHGMVNLVKTEQDIAYYMNDMSGHGTAVAGIVTDIAENAQLYSVKIMDRENKASLSSVIEGIYWCIDNNIDIINMSFGTSVQSEVLHKAIQDAEDAGILIVSSAGNGDIAGVEYPAAFEEVIAVGAVDTSAQKTEESAVGEEVELAAPGEQILAISMLGLETVVSGTSMAAPHVTGAAAVLWQKDRTRSEDFIRGLLAESANDLGDANAYGNGLVDLQYALEHYAQYAAAYEERQKEIGQTEMGSETTEMSGTDVKEMREATPDAPLLDEENDTPIETYEEIDYVEGRWWKNPHENLIIGGLLHNRIIMPISEVEIFKTGMTAPDTYFQVKYNKNNRVWHGGYIYNYIANYQFATGMAQAKGIPSKFKTVKGQSAVNRDWMTYCVNDKSIRDTKNNRWITYDEILSNFQYSEQSAAVKAKWRRMFLYGMATHIMSDTFAHSAYVKEGTSYINIKKNINYEEDDPSVIQERYIDAQDAVANALAHYKKNEMGTAIDFGPSSIHSGKPRTYYLRLVLNYAKAARGSYTDKELEKAYGPLNYNKPVAGDDD